MRGDSTGSDPRLGEVERVALRLFAELGYDAVSVQMIADAAGETPHEVRALGGKPGIYRSVIEDFNQSRNRLLEKIASAREEGGGDLRRDLEQIMEYHIDHPDVLALLQHRGLRDAADLPEVEDRWNEFINRIAAVVGPEVALQPGYQLLMNSVIWCVQGFLFGGVLTRDGARLRPDDPKARRIFREQIRQLYDLIFETGLLTDSR
ncbi:TetR family transcriptional regulator [Actinocorallia herbida]|uniref:TetR family transcriptional regulator n=1 Tax=Actinocorallia herbida TaxID=58109 RepID=A0A3N1D3C3_9ACTN|nr:TetR family transcriptional regulator [Actinocorallia herbida]ROO88033.1 TetR family transcriptional regulator [Actinocorallia herbida]